MKKKWNKIFSILCDDVREEVGNKKSIIGTYENDVIINRLPTTLARFCLIVYIKDVSSEIRKIDIQLTFPKDDPILFKGKELILNDENLTMVLQLTPFKINNEGIHSFKIFCNEMTKAAYQHKFNVKLQK